DGFRLQQILLNLLGNALKFTEHGSVSLAVSRDTTHAQRPYLRFEISDTGIGIPADHLEHIFDRFTQVDSGDSRKYGGTGLGLSICRQLTQLMEGTIQVASELGKGSTFTVTLPFSAPAAAAVDCAPQGGCDASPAAVRPHSEAQPSTPLTLLLVDDSPEIGQLAALYLKGLPYRLDRAADGPSAIQQFQTHHYDLIFLDLQMPGMDGYATATAIRAWEAAQRVPRTPIIALTADVLGPAKERSLQAGCTGFIGKPFLQTTFLEAIQQYARPADSPSSHERAQKTPSTAGQPEEPDLDRLRQKFLSNRRCDLETLTSALSTHDWVTIQTLGHRMKGLAGSYGFEEIGAIGSRLEKAAVGQEPDRITSGIEELAHILERLDPSQDQAA
ncbi:MAG: ATP-binding protein, partial [Nitrospirota bacterium]